MTDVNIFNNSKQTSIFAWLQILTLLGVALTLMITKTKAEHILLYINVILVNVCLLQHYKKIAVHKLWRHAATFIVILGVCLIYTKHRTAFIILNSAVLIFLLYKLSRARDSEYFQRMFSIVLFPCAFTLLHWLALGNTSLRSTSKNIWYSTFIAISIGLIASHFHVIKKYIPALVITLLFLHTTIQSTALILHTSAYGTASNPHYLALYSGLALAINIYFIFNTKQKWLLALLSLNTAVLGYFILLTSSRPVWIALALSSLFVLLLLTKKQRVVFITIFIVIQSALLISNTQNYRNRLVELGSNISKEERVEIWQQAWGLQQLSTPKQWTVGHGIGSFRKGFRTYSTYNSPTGYHSPHNIFLDVLYTFGVIGVGLVIYLYYLLYKGCYRILTAPQKSLSHIGCLLLSLLSINLIFNAINMPFFIVYNIYQIGFISGVLLFIIASQRLGSRPQHL